MNFLDFKSIFLAFSTLEKSRDGQIHKKHLAKSFNFYFINLFFLYIEIYIIKKKSL